MAADSLSAPTIMHALDCCLLEMACGMVKKLSQPNGLISLFLRLLPIHATDISGGCRMMNLAGKVYRIMSTTLQDSAEILLLWMSTTTWSLSFDGSTVPKLEILYQKYIKPWSSLKPDCKPFQLIIDFLNHFS